MAQIFLIKYIKGFLSLICHFGTGAIFITQEFDTKIAKALNTAPELQRIIFVMFIIFWTINIIWFVIDKYIQIKERLRKLKNNESPKKMNEK